MVRKALTAFAILMVLLFAVSATLAHLQDPASISAQSPGTLNALARLLGPDVEPDSRISGSGYIEGRHVTIAAEQGGRIAAMQADEGDVVEEGAVLIRFDDELLRAQYRKALAGLHLAQLVQQDAQDTLFHMQREGSAGGVWGRRPDAGEPAQRVRPT